MEEDSKAFAGVRSFRRESILPNGDRWLRLSGMVLLGGGGLVLALMSALTIDVTVRAYGQVRPRHPSHQVIIPISGTLSHLYVQENDAVLAGQILADLTPAPIYPPNPPTPDHGFIATQSIELEPSLAPFPPPLEEVQPIPSPINGNVFKLMTPNPGQPVEAGGILAEIMPFTTDLMVKVFIPPSEIAHIATNQSVQLQISAYPYPEYGILDGRVASISPDIVPCEGSRCIFMDGYSVIIDVPTMVMKTGDRIKPGMDVTVDIVTRQAKLSTLIVEKLRLN